MSRNALRLVVDGAEVFAHAELRDHGAGDVGRALQVVLCTGRNLADRDFFCGPSAEQDGHLVLEILPRQQVSILER